MTVPPNLWERFFFSHHFSPAPTPCRGGACPSRRVQGNVFSSHHFSLQRETVCQRETARGALKSRPPCIPPWKPVKFYAYILRTIPKGELVKASEGRKRPMLRPTNSPLWMTRSPVAESRQIFMGSGGGFLEPPPLLSFSQRREMEKKLCSIQETVRGWANSVLFQSCSSSSFPANSTPMAQLWP